MTIRRAAACSSAAWRATCSRRARWSMTRPVCATRSSRSWSSAGVSGSPGALVSTSAPCTMPSRHTGRTSSRRLPSSASERGTRGGWGRPRGDCRPCAPRHRARPRPRTHRRRRRSWRRGLPAVPRRCGTAARTGATASRTASHAGRRRADPPAAWARRRTGSNTTATAAVAARASTRSDTGSRAPSPDHQADVADGDQQHHRATDQRLVDDRVDVVEPVPHDRHARRERHQREGEQPEQRRAPDDLPDEQEQQRHGHGEHEPPQLADLVAAGPAQPGDDRRDPQDLEARGSS